MHPYMPQILYVHFQRVQKNKKLHMEVPLHFTNAEKSPGVKDQGGVVSHVPNEIDITCFPDDLPEFIEVDFGNLSVGGPRARPQAAEGRGARAEEGRNPVVATVVVPQLVTEEEEAAAAAAAVAPSEISDHRAGRRAEGRRSCRRREGREARCRQRRRQGCRDKCEKKREEVNRLVRYGSLLGSATWQGGRAHLPQRRLLARGALCAAQTASCCVKTRSSQGARRKAPRRRLASSSAVLHESSRAAGADARRLFSDQARGSAGGARRARFPAGHRALKQGGGIAGHNGLKDISQRVRLPGIRPLRIGVGAHGRYRRRRLRVQKLRPVGRAHRDDAAIVIDLMPRPFQVTPAARNCSTQKRRSSRRSNRRLNQRKGGAAR